jgi:AraC-like DNA-binding protein
MHIESGTCDESLHDFVKEYYSFANHEEQTKYVPVIDDCCYDIIFFKEANTVLTHGNLQEEIQLPFHIFTIHALTPPFKLRFENSLNFFTIKVQPWANAYFFPFVSKPGIVNIESQNPLFSGFYKKVFQLKTNAEKFDLANQLMQSFHPTLDSNRLFVKQVCELIYKHRGMITVQEISEHFEKSRQYIGKRFKQCVLYSLKKFITTVRILDLIKHRREHQNDSLTELCYQYGYFDQSHFIKDFKQVCGVTPSTFFEDLPKFLLRH